MKTSFLKKQGVVFASFALVFAVLSACGDSSSTSANENVFSQLDEDVIELTESSSSESDEDSSSSEESSTESVKKSSSSERVKVSSSSAKKIIKSSSSVDQTKSSSSSLTQSSSSSNSSSSSRLSSSSNSSSSSRSSSSSNSSPSSRSSSSSNSSSSRSSSSSYSSSSSWLSFSSYSSSSSIDFFALLSSSFDIVPLDTLEDMCGTEGATRYYMVGRKQKVYEICHNGKWVEMGSSSSSAEDTHIAMDDLFNPDISYGIFRDDRDGQSYKTVVIERSDGKIEYFAQNLNYGERISAEAKSVEDGVVEKYCYNDDSWFCDNGWGGLYTWSEAMGLPSACNSVLTGSTAECPDSLAKGTEASDLDNLQIQGVCPKGWHILNRHEWARLVYGNVGQYYSRDLLSRMYGNEDDEGFSLLPAGLLNVAGVVDYELMTRNGYFWLLDECGQNCALGIQFNDAYWIESDNRFLKTTGMSVRCVKNYPVQ